MASTDEKGKDNGSHPLKYIEKKKIKLPERSGIKL